MCRNVPRFSISKAKPRPRFEKILYLPLVRVYNLCKYSMVSNCLEILIKGHLIYLRWCNQMVIICLNRNLVTDLLTLSHKTANSPRN